MSRCGSAAPVGRLHRGTEARLQRLRPLRRAVDDVDLADAALDQAIDDARAPSRRRRARPLRRRASPSPAPQASRLAVKPSTSVLVESRRPLSYQSVLAAPTARARSSGSDIASAASLCGMVMLAPT